jgi:NADH-quinone oxidoreductase subunit I
VTIEYPYVSKPHVKLARLAISNNFDECTGCRKCEEGCPTKAISIMMDEYAPSARKPLNSKSQEVFGVLNTYRIDYSKCVMCGICLQVCPAESLSFDKHYRKPETNINILDVDLIHVPRSMRRE